MFWDRGGWKARKWDLGLVPGICTKFKPNSQAACAGSGMLRSVPAKLAVQI